MCGEEEPRRDLIEGYGDLVVVGGVGRICMGLDLDRV